jgi:hypothetical protein
VIAEKLQALVSLGSMNSRLKDFYDIWLLKNHIPFEGEILSRAIAATFSRRNTAIPSQTPVGLSDDFAREKQREWQRFLSKYPKMDHDVPDFPQVVAQIRAFVAPMLQSLANGKTFICKWDVESGWS